MLIRAWRSASVAALVPVHRGIRRTQRVFLFIFLATWNDFLLPVLMVSSAELKAVTLGLYGMISYFSPDKGAVILGALLGVVPRIILFFTLQRYWRSGPTAGTVKG